MLHLTSSYTGTPMNFYVMTYTYLPKYDALSLQVIS